MRPTAPDEGRKSALQPYLGKISAFLLARGDEDKPISVSFGTRTLTLDPWERKAIWQALCETEAKTGSWQTLIAEGTAVFLALIRALERLRGGAQQTGRSQALQELATAMGVGDNVMEGLRLELEAAVVGGHVELAKGLSTFRIRLLEALSEANRALETDQETADAAREVAPSPVPAPSPAGEAASPPESELPPAVEAEETDEAPTPAAPDHVAVPTSRESSASSASPEVATDRVFDLNPCLARATAFLRSRGREDRGLSIQFGGRALSLTVRDRRVLWQVLCEGATPESELHRQIVEGTALQLAILPALEELDTRDLSAAARQRILRGLEPIVGAATALAEEMRGTVEGMVGSGQRDDARRLSGFRNGFAMILREARRAVQPISSEVPATRPPAPRAATAASPSAATPPATGGALPGATTPVEPPAPELEPYLERATHLIQVRGNEDRPVTIPIGGKAWSFTAWERRVLWQTLCQDGAPGSPWAALVARSAAVQLGVLIASEKLRQPHVTSETREGVRQEIAVLLSLADPLMNSLGETITGQAADGKWDLAKKLKEFQEKVLDSLQVARKAI